MKLSINWLGDYLRWKETDPAAIADRLTLAVAEVEEVESEGALLAHCCVGKVLSIKKHPNADRLSLVDVETDAGRKQVVCGGTNLREGMLVAFAHIGATVRWHGKETMTLQPVVIRGETSEGMICAAADLNVQERFPAKDEHDIIDLSQDSRLKTQDLKLRVGMSLRETLEADTILHVSNTAITHRPDLFSHLGFARECVAAGLATWEGKGEPKRTLPKFPPTPLPFTVELADKRLVPRYVACTLQVEAFGETPGWMRKRLEAVGVRPINPPVDITNFVMLEEGAPLHAFDAAQIHGPSIIFRAAEEGETVTTLDGIKRTLPDGAIVLADEEGIFDLCGLMGDLRTATADGTRTFFLHAPVFDPVRTRRTIQATGLRSDASTIFEKGVPAISAERGFARALALFLELCPGSQIISKLIQWGTDGTAKSIVIDSARMQDILGTTIAPKAATTILMGLGCSVRMKKSSIRSQLTAHSSQLVVTPPLHRLRDLETEMDVLEEIARLHGYDRIAPRLPAAAIRLPARDDRLHRLRDALQEEGFTEIVPLSLISHALLKKSGFDPTESLGLQHPISDDTSLLHPSTLPSLLAHAQQNILHAGDAMKTFHGGHVFGKGVTEHVELSALLASMRDTSIPTDPFLLLKQSMNFALARAGYDLSLVHLAFPPPYVHPGRSASLVVQGETIGRLFEVHPTVLMRFDLPRRSAACTINLDLLWKIAPIKCHATSLPHFPAVVYDFTVTRVQAQPFGRLLAQLRTSDPLLEDVTVHDLYAGTPLKGGEYNVTLRCTYRSSHRTLTEEEAKAVHEKVVKLAMK